MLYDVTSTYFEGRTCPLARRGYSRDGKRDKLQVPGSSPGTFDLRCASDGCPVAVDVFESLPRRRPGAMSLIRRR